MTELKTYSTLNDISNSLYLNSDDNDEIINRLKSMSKTLNESISFDFLFLFDEYIDITDNYYFYNDATYRQSTTACLIEARLRKNNKLSFFIECLVDHNRVLIKVKDNPDLPEFNLLVSKIKKAYNSECSAELNELNIDKQKDASCNNSFWNKIKAKIRF